MKFFESIAKQVFNQEGINILEGHVAYSPEEAMEISSEMGVPVAIKVQVLIGGRGKVGGVKFAKNPGEAFKVADDVLKLEIKGEKVKHILIEERADIINKCAALLVDLWFAPALILLFHPLGRERA